MPAIERRQARIEEEARLDGIYVIRTPLPEAELGAVRAGDLIHLMRPGDIR
jgi:hypothetical protein